MDKAACDASAAMACSPKAPLDVVFEPVCSCPNEDTGNACVNVPDWYEND